MRKRIIVIFMLLMMLLPNANISVYAAEIIETTESSSAISKTDLSTISDLDLTETSTSEISNEELKDPEDLSEEKEVTEDSKTMESTETSTDQSENEEKPKVKESKVSTQAAGEELVGTWTDFVNAVRDENTTKITLTSSFSNSGTDSNLSSYQRKNDLEIDGKGFRIDFQRASIRLGEAANAVGQFHMHDVILNQEYNATSATEDIVGTRLNDTYAARWKYRFGNITAEPGVQRLARASHSEVRVYGKMDIDTRAENFYLGSFIMEDGTIYKGNVNYYNFSVFWYDNVPNAGSTGESAEFTIGENCQVSAGQTQTTGRTYPAVYHHYQSLTIGKNSVFNVDMPGNAVRFDDNGAGMTIKEGAVVNLTSKQPAGSIVAFSADNNYLNVEPGSYLYVIGNSNQPLINLAANSTGTGSSRHTGNTFVLNSPAQYDLRNLNDGKTAVNLAYGNDAYNNFTILDSDIDLWKTSSQVLGPSDETYSKVANFKVDGSGTKEVVNTSDVGLAQFKQANYRRISGMNQNPEIEWEPITDADKTMKARVKIGEVPDNNGLVNGEIKYISVYASENQAKVSLTDTYGEVRSDLMTDTNGYISYTDNNDPIKFQKAGEIVAGTAERGPWSTLAPVETEVIDATPPEPAKVNNADAIQSITTKLTGTGEPNSIITLTINDQPAGIPAELVGADGKWEIDISSLQLVTGDVIQFFLQDQSGLITALSESDRPSTNNSIGNINPKNDMNYRDATFGAATKVTVVGALSLVTVPDALEFGNNEVSNKTESYQPSVTGTLVVSDTRGGAKKPWRLTLSQTEEFKNGSISLENALYYTSQLGEKAITSEDQVVESDEFTSDGSKDISATWHGNNGFKLTVPVEKQRVGEYSGKLSWKLEDVPGN